MQSGVRSARKNKGRTMDQMSFNFQQAESYMREMFGFEEERDKLNERINTARKLARKNGVPTKAVELAIRAERNHKKAIAVVSQEEFDALREAARVLVEMQESIDELAETGVRMYTPSEDEAGDE